MIDKFNNIIEVKNIENTLDFLNKKVLPNNKMYMHRNFFNEESIEKLISDILIEHNIHNKHLVVDDEYVKKHFNGLNVAVKECDNYDFGGKELPSSYYGKMVYKKETVSEE